MIKLTMWSSKQTASCRMAFFVIPYSRKVDQIRAFKYNDKKGWEVYLMFKDGRRISSNFTYSNLSYAVSEILEYLKGNRKHIINKQFFSGNLDCEVSEGRKR